LIAEKFQPQRQWRLPRIKIDNAAADGELSPGGDLGDSLITAGDKSLEKLFHLRGGSTPQANKSRVERVAPWCGLLEACPCRDYHARTSSASDLHQDCQPFR